MAGTLLMAAMASADPPAPSFQDPVTSGTISGSSSQWPWAIAVGDVMGRTNAGDPAAPDGWAGVVVGHTNDQRITVFANSQSWSTPSNGLTKMYEIDIEVNNVWDIELLDVADDSDLDIIVSGSVVA